MQETNVLYTYALTDEDIAYILEGERFQPSEKNVQTLMEKTNNLANLTDFINENLYSWIHDDILNVSEFLLASDKITSAYSVF